MIIASRNDMDSPSIRDPRSVPISIYLAVLPRILRVERGHAKEPLLAMRNVELRFSSSVRLQTVCNGLLKTRLNSSWIDLARPACMDCLMSTFSAAACHFASTSEIYFSFAYSPLGSISATSYRLDCFPAHPQ